jgi:hypothetical protein
MGRFAAVFHAKGYAMYKTLIAAVLLASSTALFAQTPPAAPSGDSKKAERREAAREKLKGARQACDGKKGDERKSCMEQALCKDAKDADKCKARVEKGAERMKKRAEDRKAREAAKK